MAKVFTITEGLENMGALKTGGQGSVYKAKRIGEIITAVKILPTPIHSETGDDKHFTAFQNEVNKLKKVTAKTNPNVVKLLRSGITESGSLPFIEMEFIEGPDLEELLKPPHDPIFTIKEAIKVADQLSFALAHCHSADVKHGDIKSNNVKFNTQTGNYVLLDFGMSLMSDEQRRTSMRHAGAIEFMAPEQNEGAMLFETDVYSYGIVLFELLAGQVPFPLKDGGEMARNAVMLAHMENKVPDLLSLRRLAMPANWTEERKEREMHLPDWLLTTIYKCLEKAPASRFKNGVQLHDYIATNSTRSPNLAPANGNNILVLNLQKEINQLRREKENLQTQLSQAKRYQPPPQQLAPAYAPSYEDQRPVQPKRRKSGFILPLFILFALGAGAFYVYSNRKGDEPEPTPIKQTEKPKASIGQFKVLASRAYFHNDADPDTRRTAYMVPSNEVVTGLDEKNGFIYSEFTNSKGKTSKGWLRRQDLITLEEWAKAEKEAKPEPGLRPEDVALQLGDARRLLDEGRVKEALNVYSYLSEQNIPEAMYYYGNLGLQKKNEAVDCERGYELVKKASDKGYIPAKRTLGFLYLFADSEEVLRINEYEGCNYDRNVFKGSKLLMEAMMAGDSTAKRLLDEIKTKETTDTTGQ